MTTLPYPGAREDYLLNLLPRIYSHREEIFAALGEHPSGHRGVETPAHCHCGQAGHRAPILASIIDQGSTPTARQPKALEGPGPPTPELRENCPLRPRCWSARS